MNTHADDKTPLRTLFASVVTSIPVLSALIFVVVALKVFRVSGMETTTTVTIVSEADTVGLLKGVILTLLPGFLEALTAVALWWWAAVLPREANTVQESAKSVLLSREAGAAWLLTLTMFFTIAWPVFLLFFVPVVVTTGVLYWAARRRGTGAWVVRMRSLLLVVAVGVGSASLGLLTLASNPWLPLQQITVASGETLMLNTRELPDKFPAYVLSEDEQIVTLLLDDPRAVVRLERRDLEPVMPLCVPHETHRQWKIRASQVVGIDSDVRSPYPECPQP